MVTVLIFTFNAGHKFASLLDSLQEQTLKPAQIIVVDSHSTDQTVKVAESRGCKVIVIDHGKFDHGGTRTLAAKKTEGEILVFLTQDVKPFDSDALKKLIEPLDSPDIAAVFGRQIPHPDASIYASHLRLFNYPDKSYIRSIEDKETYGIKTAFLSDSFSAYKKKDLEEIGYFKSNLIFGEDICAAAILLIKGRKIAYAAHAKVYHSHNYTVSQDFKRYFDMGVFHKTEKWLLATFGKPTGEGLNYVKSEFKYLLKQNKIYLLPEFILRTTLKYFGYKVGLCYKYIPRTLTRKLSMNYSWWDQC